MIKRCFWDTLLLFDLSPDWQGTCLEIGNLGKTVWNWGVIFNSLKTEGLQLSHDFIHLDHNVCGFLWGYVESINHSLQNAFSKSRGNISSQWLACNQHVASDIRTLQRDCLFLCSVENISSFQMFLARGFVNRMLEWNHKAMLSLCSEGLPGLLEWICFFTKVHAPSWDEDTVWKIWNLWS